MRLEPGRLVTSTAGRDRGQPYLVCEVMRDGFVLVADGDKRPVSRPKRKNPRHLQLHGASAEELGARWMQGEAVKDEEVRTALATLATKLKEAG